MLTINFPRHDPSSRTLDALPARDLTHTAPAQPGNGEPGVACSASDFPHTGALGYASIWRRPSLLLGNVRDLSGGSDWSVRSAPNSGRERDSLIGAEISLIADLNSLQGRKKFPVRMRRELAHNALIYCPFLLPFTRRGASNR